MSWKIAGTLATSLWMALSAAGADAPLPQLRVEPKAGGSIFFIKNSSSQPLTGYLIELVDYPGSFFQLWQEEILTTPVAPGAEKRIEVANMTVGAVPDYVKLEAAIYADGSTAGIPGKIDQLVARRRFTLSTVQDLIRRLEVAEEANTTKERAVVVLRHVTEFMLLPSKADKASQLAVNQGAGREVVSMTDDYLAKHTVKETIEQLHAWEHKLTESKPSL